MHKGSALDNSPFLSQLVRNHPGWLDELQSSGRLDSPSPPDARRLEEDRRQTGLDSALRRFRNREMLRLIWRDLDRLAPLPETLADLSTLAEICLQACCRVHGEAMEKRFGAPRNANGARQGLVVLGLGKLGGRELNLSSDIDLVFCFPEQGRCDGQRGLDNEQFFTKLARRIINSLANVTGEGFCFRVDTRLRPFGASGPLVSNFDALEQYYQREGRDWERYALIKARPVAGDTGAGDELLQILKPFVYRRYIDFGAIESMREMHASVRQDAQRRDRLDDIKRGPGGIREIEFLVQSFQLLRGGREPLLRTPSLFSAVEALRELKMLSGDVCQELLQAYAFLRLTENRIQALRDQQTHRVPGGEDGLRVAHAMGYADRTGFDRALEATRARVGSLFDQSLPDSRPVIDDKDPWHNLWQSLRNVDRQNEPPPGAAKPLLEFAKRVGRLSLSQRAGQRLDVFVPLLLGKFAARQTGEAVQNRVFDLVSAICRRSAYLSLLVQNPLATERMLDLFTRSRRVAETVTRYPALLDELIDPSLGASPPAREDIEAGIDKIMEVHKDTETTLESLNYLKQAVSLRIAVALLGSSLPAAAAQRALSNLAECLIGAVLQLSRLDMEQRHGSLPGSQLCVVAYGSLGARTPGFDSDLDLIFLYQPGEAQSGGARPLTAERYHTATVRRLLSLLSALTPSGRLYTTDARLRPNGRAGLLLSSIDAFRRYQQEQAWVWELQALTRARPVAGETAIAENFVAVRLETLTQVRDTPRLATDIRDMRARVQEQNAGGDPLKYGPGGMLDIEFVTQLGLLSNAAGGAGLFRSTEISRQLQALSTCGWLAGETCGLLSEAYMRLNQAKLDAVVDDAGVTDVEGLLSAAQAVCDRVLRENAMPEPDPHGGPAH